jgi:hypothetical protein
MSPMTGGHNVNETCLQCVARLQQAMTRIVHGQVGETWDDPKIIRIFEQPVDSPVEKHRLSRGECVGWRSSHSP